jgi:hypothetical protein
MSSLDKRLKAVGYNVKTPPAGCWRVERIGPPLGECSRRAAPVRSRALALWLDRLCERGPSPFYRIRLADDDK